MGLNQDGPKSVATVMVIVVIVTAIIIIIIIIIIVIIHSSTVMVIWIPQTLFSIFPLPHNI